MRTTDYSNHADTWTRIARQLDAEGDFENADRCDRIAEGFLGRWWGNGKDEEIYSEDSASREPALLQNLETPQTPDRRHVLYVAPENRTEIERVLRESPHTLAPYRVIVRGRWGKPDITLN